MKSEEPDPATERVERLTSIMASGSVHAAQNLLQAMNPAEIADVLESMPAERREILWELVNPQIEGEVLLEVHDEVRDTLVRIMDPDEIRAASENMDLDDLADFVQSLPEQLTSHVLAGMDVQDRQRLESVLIYPENSAGGLMDLDAITVRGDVTLDVVLRYLRRRGEMPRNTDRLIVVNRYGHYRGNLPLRRLLTHNTDALVSSIMRTDAEPIHVLSAATDVAKRFEDEDLVSAAVVDDDGLLLGRITIDDVVDVIRDEAEQSVMSMAGLNQEDDIFSPVVRSARKRAVWLGVNLLTAFLASWVIAQFEATLEQIVTLAVLMTIAPSMGGIAGSQTLTLMIRGQALGQINRSNTRSLLLKELSVGMLNGLLWAVIVCSLTILWFGEARLGLLLGAALIINLMCAALVGWLIPIILRRVGVDPALAGGVVLTTVTDVVGLIAFLGLATLMLL